MQIVIDMPEEIYKDLQDEDEISDGEIAWLILCIKYGTVLSDNPTNGEVIQALFPNIYEGFSNVIDLNLWWYGKYKAKEQEK